jgi:D-glycero-D-manno-heptose 1,7-bisphosphate phosphatase
MRRAVFLDRDGVLNRALVRDGLPYAPKALGEFELLPGVKDACLRLQQGGFLVIVVTNQPDIARGVQTESSLDEMHRLLRDSVRVDDILVCSHDNSDRCECRKPLPGLLLKAARDWNVCLKESFVVGDRWRDVDAGVAAGCTTIFLDHGYREPLRAAPDCKVQSLPEATDWILKQQPSPVQLKEPQ